jgi:membrane protease YdiL (CAAX protease family)
MFALAHGCGVVGSVSTFLFGLVLGLGFLWGRSLPRLILAHWIYDLMLFYGYPWRPSARSGVRRGATMRIRAQ